MSPETAVRMGLAARRRTETCFDRQRCVDAYDDLYRRLGQARRDAR